MWDITSMLAFEVSPIGNNNIIHIIMIDKIK